MTDDERLADAAPLIGRLPAGSAVVVRARDAEVRADRARALLEPCRRHGVLLLIADDADLARQLGADGVHLPEETLRLSPQRPQGSPGWLVTASAHSAEAIDRARQAGVDAVILSPVFATPSHPGAACLGLTGFAKLASAAGLPVYAMGGVGEADAAELEAVGAAGIAGIGFVS